MSFLTNISRQLIGYNVASGLFHERRKALKWLLIVFALVNLLVLPFFIWSAYFYIAADQTTGTVVEILVEEGRNGRQYCRARYSYFTEKDERMQGETNSKYPLEECPYRVGDAIEVMYIPGSNSHTVGSKGNYWNIEDSWQAFLGLALFELIGIYLFYQFSICPEEGREEVVKIWERKHK